MQQTPSELSGLTNKEKEIYNHYLKALAEASGRPYKKRINFDNFKPADYEALKKLALFFNKYKHIYPFNFFRANFSITGEKYLQLDYFNKYKSIANYSKYNSARYELSADTIKKDLKQYFLSHFKPTEYSCFEHDASLSLNEVYSYVSAIFENQENLAQQSKYLAQSLYRKGVHPNIKGGEFYVVYFKNCLLDGEMTDAVGLFKSENKDSFLKVQRNGDRFEILQELGVNINKLDKGCLIFNTNKEDGYVVSVVDNSNRGEAKYWVEDFLQVKRKNDSYTQTQNAMTMCKSFISQLPSDIDKADKAEMMKNG